MIAAAFGCIHYTHETARGRRAFAASSTRSCCSRRPGMVLIVAANDLIVVFIALEILSLSLYVLTGIGGTAEQRGRDEVLPAGGVLLGVLPVRGGDGLRCDGEHEDHRRSSARSRGQTGSQALALLAMGLLVIGFGFKVSAAPFHMWTPDVYQGAPTPVVAFMSAATKVAAFFALMRVLDVALAAADRDVDAGRLCAVGDLGGARRRARGGAARREADAGVLERRARRVHPGRSDVAEHDRDPRGDVLPDRVHRDDRGRLRRDDGRGRQDRRAVVLRQLRRARGAEPRPRGAAHDLPPVARGDPADGRVHREGDGVRLGDPRGQLAARGGRACSRA